MDYTGAPTDAVKVGTMKRAKGPEFKQVLISDVSRKQTSGHVPTDDTERERWDLDRRELYVAMTRARDGLGLELWGRWNDADARPKGQPRKEMAWTPKEERLSRAGTRHMALGGRSGTGSPLVEPRHASNRKW